MNETEKRRQGPLRDPDNSCIWRTAIKVERTKDAGEEFPDDGVIKKEFA